MRAEARNGPRSKTRSGTNMSLEAHGSETIAGKILEILDPPASGFAASFLHTLDIHEMGAILSQDQAKNKIHSDLRLL